MQFINVRRSVVAGFAGLLTAGVLAACGSDSSAGGDGTINLVVSEGNSLPFIGAEAGNDLGVWEDKGIEVNIIEATSDTTAATLASGDADLSLESGNRIVAGANSGVGISLTAGCLLPWDQHLAVADDLNADEPADLKGKNLGISGFGSAGHFATLKMADSLGWKKGDYKITQMGSLDNLVAGLKKGTIDAFLWSVEPVLTLKYSGEAKDLGSVADLVGPNAFEAFSVRDQVAEERPDDVKAFFEGYFDAVKQLQNDPQKAIDIMVDSWKKDPKVAKEAVESMLPKLSTDGGIPEDNQKGLEDAVHLTIENSDDYKVGSIYKYWQDLG